MCSQTDIPIICESMRINGYRVEERMFGDLYTCVVEDVAWVSCYRDKFKVEYVDKSYSHHQIYVDSISEAVSVLGIIVWRIRRAR